MALTYDPNIFDARTLEDAKQIILTRETSTTEQRWQVETPYLADMVLQSFAIPPDSLVLDYGCGIGRMAKELIARCGCAVVGVDISPNMRAMAPGYVQSDRFCVCTPTMLDTMIERRLRFDAALAIWVLQHCLRPMEDIVRLQKALRTGGGLFVLNNVYRAVPTREKMWVNDGIDIKAMLTGTFTLTRQGKLPLGTIPDSLAGIHFWASFRVPGESGQP